MKAVMDACIDTVEDVDNPDYGHQCAGLFYKLPSKKDYPEYCMSEALFVLRSLLTSYTVIIILKPICLDQIKKKISTWKYETLDENVADFRLMFNNARTFNDESSIVYRDANLMEAAFNEKFAEMTSAGGPQQSESSLALNDYMPMVKQNQDSDDDLF
jgi:ATP-dependent helicase STH1/SNF2